MFLLRSLLVFIFLISSVYAELTPMDDEALDNHYGQAIFKLEEGAPIAGQPDVSFTRLTLGLKIEVNSNVDEIVLGRYHRNNGTECSNGGRTCANTSGAFRQWNCSVSSCGGITDDNGNNPFSASALVHGDLIGLSGAEKLGAALASLFGNAYASAAPFTDSSIFPSGFQYTQDADIRLRDATLGRIVDNADGTRTIEDFVIEKPYVEFAYDDSGPTREVVGLRVGFGNATGVQGNAIDVLSGFVQPVVTATADAGIGTGTFTFAPYLGGVRTAGYIDRTRTIVGDCSGTGLSGIVCGEVDSPEKIADSSPQAQLFPLQNLTLNNSPSFWFSLQSRPIQYRPAENSAGQTINFEQAQPGVWINMGALSVIDGSGNAIGINQLSAATGISVNTSQPLHPDNYFAGNARLNTLYPQSNNYY